VDARGDRAHAARRARVELARALEPRTEAGAQVRDLLVQRLHVNSIAFDRDWHIEYTEHGRALALAETLAALERTPADDVSRIGAELSVDADRIAASSDSLAW
jgi:hypothetical protein